jgi:hypothetical protein
MRTKIALLLVFVAIVIIPATANALDPTASATTTDVSTAGGTSYSFTVRYSDDGPIPDNSFDDNDVRVSGPGSYDVPAKFISASFNGSGQQATVTYSIIPPGGSWDSADNGTYTVVMQADQVFDGLGNPVKAGAIGSFTVNVPPSSPTPTPTPGSTAGLVGNVSTRLPVGVDDNVLIEGFIVQGPAGSTKKIIVRALGPFLAQFGIADALANPTLEIHDANNATVATNNDWKVTQVGGLITGDQSAEISASGVKPANDLESAIIADLAPGSYTAVVAGAGRTIGTAIVDAYDLSAASPARLANIATRGLIQPGDKLMIAGFIVQNGPVKAVIRAIGPSLSAFGITNALPDTTLQLRDENGVIVLENDDWRTDQQQAQELQNVGLQPSNDLEAALIATIPPGQYTAQVRGKNEATGIGVVEIYFLQ